MFSKETYMRRRSELRSKVKSGLILIPGNSESPINYPSNHYPFRQDSNFLYFFGLSYPDLIGVMDIDAGTDCLFADDYTLDDFIWMGVQPSVREIGDSIGIKRTFGSQELHKVLSRAIKNGRKIHYLPPYRDTNTLLLKSLLGIKSDYVKDYVSAELIKAVVSMREVKEDQEIEQIEEACDTAYHMHTEAMKMCKPGVMEREIAGRMMGISLSRGHGVSFHPIVTQNGEYLHNPFHGNKLQDGRLLLIDSGAESNMNYTSDFTRTLPVNGKFTGRQKDVYNIVLAAHDRAFGLITSGVTYQSIHLEAMKVIASGLKDLGIFKGEVDDIVANGASALFMPHGLGHQMGLDVHDMEALGEKYVGYNEETERSNMFGLSSLRMGRKLFKGHVLTVEPGIYFIPGLIAKWKKERINTKFINYDAVDKYLDFGGVRLENDALVLDKGCRMLGRKKIPLTIEEVEQAMKKS